MKNPRHQFVLVGFLSQALAWDNYLAFLFVIALWCFSLAVLRGRIRVTLITEAAVLFFGCLLSFAISKVTNASAHFFLGDGLILLQTARLIRPLNRREKLTSILIACFHFGVLCTLAQNIRFAILFAAAVVLLPKALEDLQLDEFGEHEHIKPPFGLTRYFKLLGVSIVLFMALPRFFAGAPLFQGLADQGTLLDSILDPRHRGSANSDVVLMQIEGKRVGYLRCYALPEFDGIRWTMEPKSALKSINRVDPKDFKPDERRQVRVKNAAFLGRVLPIDGVIDGLRGNFFEGARQNSHGTIECAGMWNTANNFYEYWVNPDPAAEALSSTARRHLTGYPEQSARLREWLDHVTTGATNKLHAARKIEKYLRQNYTYKIGTPELDRINPVEDFIFNRRDGHCERFAAALGLLFRMQSIPSRVVIGYVATTRNPFSGWQQVRFRDAHSWTEAYIDGQGWMKFDATPGPPAGESDWNVWHIIEALDFAWYSHVVNFDGLAQKQMFNQTAQRLAKVPGYLERHWLWMMAALLTTMTVMAARKKSWKLRFPFQKKAKSKAVLAKHYYGRMLQLLDKNGYERHEQQTPYEFLANLREADFPAFPEAQLLTQTFCESNYGKKTVSNEMEQQLEQALARLRHNLRQEKGKPSVPVR
jgi:hypothetical protein